MSTAKVDKSNIFNNPIGMNFIGYSWNEEGTEIYLMLRCTKYGKMWEVKREIDHLILYHGDISKVPQTKLAELTVAMASAIGNEAEPKRFYTGTPDDTSLDIVTLNFTGIRNTLTGNLSSEGVFLLSKLQEEIAAHSTSLLRSFGNTKAILADIAKGDSVFKFTIIPLKEVERFADDNSGIGWTVTE